MDGLKIAALDADPAGAAGPRGPMRVPLFAAEAEADEARLAHLIDARSRTANVVLVDTAGFGNRRPASR
jgi:chromosome partitioning protein